MPILNPYQRYALSQEAPNIFADMVKKESEKRTADLAKNMFAQLQGMDPESKEYYQKMREAAMTSGDDTLYQTGEALNKSQQGYVFDNPLYTSDVKEYMLTSGDTELQNPAALDAFIQRSNRSKATNVNINNIPAPMTNEVPDRYLTQQEIEDYVGDQGAFGPWTTVSQAKAMNARRKGNDPSQDQQDAALTALSIDQTLGIMPNYQYPRDAGNPLTYTGARTLVATGLEDINPQISQIIMPSDVKQAKDVAESSLPWITQMITGADATTEQKEQYKRILIPQPLDPIETRVLKNMRLNQIRQVSALRAVGKLPDVNIRYHSPGNLVVGKVRLPNGSDMDIVSSEELGMAYVNPKTHELKKIDDWNAFLTKAASSMKK